MKNFTTLCILLFCFLGLHAQENLSSNSDLDFEKIEVKDITYETLTLSGAESLESSVVELNSEGFLTARTGAGSGISETVGQASVSPTGGAVYNVPIMVPPGINGIQPEIALTYNSHGGNGLAGFGWNISGVSVITRIASTKFHDNNIDPVDFDNLDRYAFDGQRLILKSGTYGGDGAQYETENFSNVKITSHGVSPFGAAYGPSYFKVTYPDGSFAYYGNNTDSRSRTDFAITYWENPQGIRVSYTYALADNSLSISSIKYGSRGTAAPLNEIQFIYKARKRPEQSFISGIDFRRKTILSEIRVKSNSIGYRNYVLTHGLTTLGYEKLASLQEKSGDNTLSYSPVTFSYTSTPNTVSTVNVTTDLTLQNIEQRNAVVVPFDLTGDGRMDFIVHPKNATEKNKFWVFKDPKSETTAYKYDVGSFESIHPVTTLTSTNKILSGQGFALIQNNGISDVKFKIYSNSITIPIQSQYERIWSSPTISLRDINCDYSNCEAPLVNKKVPKIYLSGDFNGDGLSDIVAIEKSFNYSYCDSDYCDTQTGTASRKKAYFINLDRRITSGFVTSLGDLQDVVASTGDLSTADVNGDGKTDIIHVTAGKLRVYTLNNSSNALQLLWTTTDTRIKTQYPMLLGDYNGDGKSDFIIPTANNNSTFALFLSTGTAFVKRERVLPFQYQEINWNSSSATLYSYNLIPVDVNGDGRTDILNYLTTTYNGNSNGVQRVNVYHNEMSTETDVTPAFVNGGYATRTGNLKHYPIPIFLTSDKPNSNLEFASISNQWVTSFQFNKDNREDVLLRAVNSNGVYNDFIYRELVNNEYGLDGVPAYLYASNEVYPYVDIQVAKGTKVVVALTRVGSGIIETRKVYSYYGAVTNAEGLGFMGFKGTAVSNLYNSLSDRIFSTSKSNPQLRGAVTDTYESPGFPGFTIIPSNYISKTSYVYTSTLSASKVFNIKNTSNVTQNSLNVTTNTNQYVYDVYNNPTKITTNYSGQGSKVIDITYANSTGTTYYIGRPTKKVETVTVGTNTFSTEDQYTYTGYLLTQKKVKGNGTDFNTETYTYDAFGNIIKTVTTPFGEPARQVSAEYDTSGRFLTKAIDVEGLATTFTYNINNGTLATEKNPFNLTTTYTYDAWFRLTKVTDYLGKNVTTSYTESTGNNYTVAISGDDGSGRTSEYDLLKRLIKVREKDVLGQWVEKRYEYDATDRPIRESEVFIGSPSQWNQTEYDLYGRVKKQTLYTGKIISLTYSGLSVTVNDGIKSVTTTKDAMGNVTRVQDPGGTIDYTYFGNGNMKTAIYSGTTLSMEQDGWGRKTKLTDPSAGIYTYEYNGFGEVTKETTPKGSTDYTYTTTGKLRYKVINGDNTNTTLNYSYDSVSKLLNSMSYTSPDGGASYAYTYDANKRITSVTENNSYANFKKNYTYDAFGRIATEESIARNTPNPSQLSTSKITNVYQNGGLKSIKDFTTDLELWNLAGINARGQVTSSTAGTNIKKTSTYNAEGFVTEIKSDKMSGTTVVAQLMRLTFNFNSQRGILNSRTNSLFSWTENFTYDSMDRLLTFNDNSGNKTQAYDTKGRITTNSQAGTYGYNGNTYQLAQLTLNAVGESNYNTYTKQQISYNAFKSPVEIVENVKERISFDYNAFQGRSTMFYGDTQADKTQRRFRKCYSFDGSMEITYDKQTNKTTFVNYIGGDAYSAPAILHSEQGASTVNNFYYLHRDYLGSILMITDKDSNIKEKRHFDAWGNIAKLQDGAGANLTTFKILDRGYTAHEHLVGVGLVHMNGRLYDPMLHRFLSPDNYVQDPFNTQNFNRYGYVLNNPLMFTDPSGEIPLLVIAVGALIGAAVGGAAYIGSAIRTGNWNWGQFGLSILGGAILGGLTAGQLPASIGASYLTATLASGFAAGLIPTASFNVGNWNFSISPAIAFGKGLSIGANFSVGFNDGNFSVSGGYGISYGSSQGTGATGWEYRRSWGANWDDGKSGFGLYSTTFSSGETSQKVGGLSLRSGDFGLRYENDDSAPFNLLGNKISGGTDSYRSAAFQLSYKDYSIGFNLFTGNRDYDDYTNYGFRDEHGNKFRNGMVTTEGANNYRLGALYAGYKGYRAGVNSEHIRHAIQNVAAHSVITQQAGFKNMSWDWKSYFQYQSANQYTLW